MFIILLKLIIIKFILIKLTQVKNFKLIKRKIQ